MTHWNIVIHRYQALILLLAYTLCAISIGRNMHSHPVLLAVEFTSSIIVASYLLYKLFFHCTGQEHHARAQYAAEVVP